MLEQLLRDLIAAITANTEALKATPKTTKGAKPKDETAATPPAETARVEEKKPESVTPPAPVYPTQQDVIDAATALMDANGNDGKPLAPLTEKYKSKPLRNCPEDKRADLIADLKKLTADALKAKGETSAI